MLNLNFKKLIKIIIQKKSAKYLLVVSLSVIFLSLIILFSLFIYFKNKIAPNTYVLNTNLSSQTQAQAETLLKKAINPPQSLALISEGQILTLSLQDIGFSYDFQETSENAFNLYRQNHFPFYSFSFLQSFKKKTEINLSININQEKLNEYILVISDQLSKSPVYPSAHLDNETIVIEKGQPGKTVAKSTLTNLIINNLEQANFTPIQIPFTETNPSLSDQEVNNLKTKLNNLIGKKIELQYDNTSLSLNDKDIIPIFPLSSKFDNQDLDSLVEKVKQNVERDAQDAVLNFENGKVIEFTPSLTGITVTDEIFKNDLLEAIRQLEDSEENSIKISLAVTTKNPQITTDSVNDLGINELIGKGSSSFRGSIPARVFNVGHAAQKFNGILIAPGETFSFNKTLGDVSQLTGYKQAYIIKDGKTVLGDGGGVCQVSTTMFRASLDAGLPIVERRGHSYRVGYYEQDLKPGIDATVYDPTTDFKFKNDTPAHILIQTIYNENARTLSFEFYGTSDGRVSNITTPIIYDVTPPPEDLYIDDPNLPAGEIKQIDYKAWGAKTKFDYTVIRGEEIIYEKTFYTTYQPWQAKYLRGTKT